MEKEIINVGEIAQRIADKEIEKFIAMLKEKESNCRKTSKAMKTSKQQSEKIVR